MIDTDKYENHDMIRIAKQLLIEDAPLLLAEVKRLRKVIGLIGHNMAYDPWMHTLIKEAIGYEKEMIG